MASPILTEYIQSIVDNVVHHNEPFDDSKKKWLRRYGELEHLDEEEIDVIINSIEGFFEALKELMTKESRYIEIMARKLGHNSCLSESKIDEYIKAVYKTKKEDLAQMQADIQSNIAATENAKQLCQKETDRLANLRSTIVMVQNTKAKTIHIAEKEAFEHIEPQWEQEQEALSASKKRCESIKNQISQTQNITADWQDKTIILHEKADSIIEQRKKLIHHILLIALGVFFSLAEFLLFEDKWVVCVPFVMNAVFIFHRLGIVQDLNFKNYPEFLFSFIPLVIINFEAFLIVSIFDNIWLLMCFVLILTTLAFLCCVTIIYEDSKDKKKATHHFLLVTVALLASLFEFFSFGCDGLDVFDVWCDDPDYGWGFAFVPFLCNILFVFHRFANDFDFDLVAIYHIIDGYKGREWQENNVFLEYLYSIIFLVIINGYAIWTHNGWAVYLVLIYPFSRILFAGIYKHFH